MPPYTSFIYIYDIYSHTDTLGSDASALRLCFTLVAMRCRGDLKCELAPSCSRSLPLKERSKARIESR